MATDNNGATWVLPILELEVESHMGSILKVGPLQINVGPGGIVEVKNHQNSRSMLVSQMNPIADGVWHHITITGKKHNFKDEEGKNQDDNLFKVNVFIDGKKTTNGRLSFPIINKESLSIVVGDIKFNGFIDEISLYNSVLTEEEIISLSHIPFWDYHNLDREEEITKRVLENKNKKDDDKENCKGVIYKKCDEYNVVV